MKALVTGGGGFLGSAIVRALCDAGHAVTVLGRGEYPHLASLGVRFVRADIRAPSAICSACEAMDAVFHTAAKAGVWGPKREFHAVNVDGTRNVIEACRLGGVPKLVYTSTPSVVFAGRDLCGVNESQPYAPHFLCHYAATKAAAERMVLDAHGRDLSTVAIRPHLLFGPGDPHLLPRIIERARRGRLRQVGSGQNRVDLTYIDNAAQAHLDAAERLGADSPCGGKAYFISNDEPVTLWAWINELLGRAGLPVVRRPISLRAAYTVGRLLECAYAGLRLRGEPPMTRFVALQLAKSHYFDISAARRDLGYVPRVALADGLARWEAATFGNSPSACNRPSSR